ncbi:MAG: hydantoinase/oxoprolinase family protein [Bacillati bacterium ANGP1]|uniref:Hydantoinase/oxoprolinase family protein n=1 Tax=Candidatus Segetimicrobium genomatis TaxID=2569760 RepID=A0A537JX02_9BACT|nr:MAG: hydantoinase/oxoprolinase family protein [Terrabacteria group bacterium ANGP1]
MFRIGIDVGGTFTDLVAVDEAGRVALTKSASTPDDPSRGILEGLGLLAGELGRDLAALLAETDRLVHGTTVATNALVERKGARVGLLTTEGHRDVLEMREGLKEDRYNLRMPPPVPLVPRALRIGIRERIRFDGTAAVPLSQASVEAGIRALERAGVESVAICYLHAYRNPRHEAATRRRVAERMPAAYISVSSDVLPQIKEYERVCTTVVNAYVGPALSRYLGMLATRLTDAGYRGDVLIMQSHGGVAGIQDSVRLAAGAILSGPAGGLAGSRYCARLLGGGDFITFDMGGTSTDIALLEGGEPPTTGDKVVGGHKVALPSLDIHTLGAGGGSIARVDPGGILHVGPQSAGAVPGPACYGRGGSAATVTDASVVLGFLDPANFLGGRTPLDAGAGQRAVEQVAGQLGCSAVDAAEGIHKVVNTAMAEGIRIVSVRRGVDPRRFTLLAFGGAAGLHITQVARQLEIGRVVIPRVAAVLSAWGMLATDLRYELVRTQVGEVHRVGAAGLGRLFAEMEAEGRMRLGEAATGAPLFRKSLDMRYGEQIYEIGVPLDGLAMDAPDLIDQVVERFRRRHEALYTYSAEDQDVVLVNARLTIVGALPVTPVEPRVPAAGAAAPAKRRRAYLGAWTEVPVYRWDSLTPKVEVGGPAIFESATTTVVVRAGDQVRVTPYGWLDIRMS